LIELEHQVKDKMKQDFIDLDYWENILKILNVYKARAKLQKYIKTVILEKKEFKRQEFKPYMEPEIISTTNEEELVFTQSQNQQYIQESRNEILQKYQIQQTTESLFQETIEQRQALYQQMVRDASVDTEDEEIFKSNFDFGEKYKPRKPDYYNRIKHGIEWNKYNTVHYNQGNPPPKSILGYKYFCINEV
jgi:acetone carboxylase gamma subunit